jgi:hypothetical protein
MLNLEADTVVGRKRNFEIFNIESQLRYKLHWVTNPQCLNCMAVRRLWY